MSTLCFKKCPKFDWQL